MALSPNTYQYITQLGLLRKVDASTGPEGPEGVTAFLLVPANGYHNGDRLPYDVTQELAGEGYDHAEVDGVKYYLVPEESTNLPGRLAHYAQKTGVAELANPPGGGVNRVRETLADTAGATVAPDEVAKYVGDNDSYEEARKKQSEEDARVARQVGAGPVEEPKAESKKKSPTSSSGPSSASSK